MPAAGAQCAGQPPGLLRVHSARGSSSQLQPRPGMQIGCLCCCTGSPAHLLVAVFERFRWQHGDGAAWVLTGGMLLHERAHVLRCGGVIIVERLLRVHGLHNGSNAAGLVGLQHVHQAWHAGQHA